MILTIAERPHAPLSPSSFDRISRCTKSFQLARTGCTVGQDALVGTAAHAVLEAALRGQATPARVEVVVVDGTETAVTDEMRGAVQVTLDYVAEHLHGREILVEHQVTLPWGRVFGYLDIATATPPWGVIDFRHGFNAVAASAPQLGLYLLALILERDRSVEGEGSATSVIIQPRAQAEPVRSHVWSYAELRALRDRLIATLDRIRRVDFTYADGLWCRWCSAAGVCPRLAAVARDAVAADLAVPELVAAGELGAEQLDAALAMAPALEHRIRQTHAAAKQYLMSGGKLPNFKLIAKRTGSLAVVGRDDPRPEVDVEQTLAAALRSSTAASFRAGAVKAGSPGGDPFPQMEQVNHG
jgi:hypothetical protein